MCFGVAGRSGLSINTTLKMENTFGILSTSCDASYRENFVVEPTDKQPCKHAFGVRSANHFGRERKVFTIPKAIFVSTADHDNAFFCAECLLEDLKLKVNG